MQSARTWREQQAAPSEEKHACPSFCIFHFAFLILHSGRTGNNYPDNSAPPRPSLRSDLSVPQVSLSPEDDRPFPPPCLRPQTTATPAKRMDCKTSALRAC